jgi:acyl-CoA synthetase (NDP forming)
MLLIKDVLNAIFYPQSIALYAEHAYRSQVIDGLLRHGYTGQIIPIAADVPDVLGIPTQRALHSSPDVAVIALPIDATFAALDACVQHGVKAAVVVTWGFAEFGTEGEKLQQQLLERAHGLRILGPNCLGVINTSNGAVLCSTMALNRVPMLRGNISLFSHSGSLLGSTFNYGQAQGIGFRYLAALGNEADLALDDLIEFALDDAETRVIAVIMEHVRHPERFVQLADAAAHQGKPLVILKLGRSTAAKRIARSHTAALTGDDRVYDAVFEKYGIIRVHTPEELVFTSALLAESPRPKNRRVAILASSGGMCGLLADLAADAQLELAPLHDSPPPPLTDLYGTNLDNPLDLGRMRSGVARKSPSVVRQLAEGLNQHPAVDVVLVGLGAMSNLTEIVQQLVAGVHEKPLIAYNALGEEKSTLRALGIIPIEGAALAVRATKALIDYADFQRHYSTPINVPPVTLDAKPRLMNMVESLQLLSEAGLPIPPLHIAHSAEESTAHALQIGFPVALKIVSDDAHKTEIGGVLLNLETVDAVRAGYQRLGVESVVVQPMVRGVEMILGSFTDSGFGPVVLIGMGGIYAEVFRDTVVALPPLTEAEVYRLVVRLRGMALLRREHARDGLELASFVRLVVQFGRVVAAWGAQIQSIDINPVIVSPDGVHIVDALIERSLIVT